MIRFLSHRIGIVCVLLAGVLLGCHHREEDLQQLVSLDNLIYTAPSMVLTQLDSIDVAIPLSRRDRMHLELLRGVAMNKADSLFTTDSVMLMVVDYYDRHGSANERMQAHYTLGCAYRDMGNAPRAVACYQEAAHCADTLSQDCDYPTLMRVHSQMANIYKLQKLFEESIQEAQIAEKYCWQMGDTLSAIAIEGQICTALYNIGEFDKCVVRTTQLYDKCKNLGFADNAALQCLNLARCYMGKGEYGIAKNYLDKYETCSYFYTHPERIEGGLAPFYINKGNYYRHIEKLDSAEYCYRNAIPYINTLHNEVPVYWGLMHVFSTKNEVDSTLKYAVLYGELEQKSFNSSIAEATMHMKSLYDYTVEQEIAQRKTEEAARTRVYVLVLALCACGLLALVLYVLYRKTRNEKELNVVQLQLQRTMEQYRETEDRLQYYMDEKENLDSLLSQSSEEITQHQQEKERIAYQLEQTNQELERLAREVQSQQSLILHQKGEIMSLNSVLDANDPTKRHALLSLSAVVRRFRDSLYKRKMELGKDDWHELDVVISNQFPMFISKISTVGNLQPNEYRICLLVKAGFEPYEIDSLLGKQHSYASNLRKRLHTKVFGANGTAAEFDRKIRLMD